MLNISIQELAMIEQAAIAEQYRAYNVSVGIRLVKYIPELNRRIYKVNADSGTKIQQIFEQLTMRNCYAVQPVRRYRFLVMAGSDDRRADELPDSVCTKLKNKLHRTVFLELGLYADGKGVVRNCYYCDRAYRQGDRRVTPPSLVSCFFPYTRQGVLELVNRELICDFTHIIITGDIDPKHCNSPICGNI